MSETAAATPPRRLSLVGVLWGTFALTWRNRAEVARTAGLPLLLVIFCTLGWDLASFKGSQGGRWTFWLIYLLTNSWLALATLRMVLVDQPAPPTQFDAAAWRRLGLFALMVALLWVLYSAIKLGFMLVALNFLSGGYVPAGAPRPEAARDLPVSMAVLDGIASWVPYLLVARFCLLLPMVATDRPCLPLNAWRESVGNGLKLAVIIGVLPWLLDEIVDLMYRDGASRAEFGVLVVVSSFCTVLEVVALSLAYRQLTDITAPAPPPTDPRG